MSEIDDIFASKGKAKATPVSLRDPPPSSKLSSKQHKKKKKQNALAPTDSKAEKAASERSSPKKRPLPETVVDSSHSLLTSSKRHKGDSKCNDDTNLKSTKADRSIAAKDAEFKNSRGTSSRRKTDEGWSIYKEDELGIGDQGGDTPLCPFDCNCCF